MIRFFLLFMMTSYAFGSCDVAPDTALGIKVIRFFSGEKKISKFLLKEASPRAIQEEMINLQDIGLCSSFIPKVCRLKLEKKGKIISFYRDEVKWIHWKAGNFQKAKIYFEDLKKIGICSNSAK